MDVLGAVVARDRRSGRPAVHVAAADRTISYHDFCTTAYKAGNVLRYLGVREEAVVVVGGPVGPQPLWALYGAAQLGAVTEFVDVAAVGDDREATTDARVLLLPVDREDAVEPSP
jgi:acyl-coenzyme A synthetase/AMP-(fatty) acid ligase